jgi:Tat protein secretion system quality control protein TatD with DNase activity
MLSSYNASAGRAFNSYSSVGVRQAASRENNSSACTTTNENMSIIDEEQNVGELGLDNHYHGEVEMT